MGQASERASEREGEEACALALVLTPCPAPAPPPALAVAPARYNKVFVDAYWNSREKSFHYHLFRLMSSWAVVVDIWFLDPQTIRPGEDGAAFATRIQRMIASRANLRPVTWDGYMKRVSRRARARVGRGRGETADAAPQRRSAAAPQRLTAPTPFSPRFPPARPHLPRPRRSSAIAPLSLSRSLSRSLALSLSLALSRSLALSLSRALSLAAGTGSRARAS